LLSAFFGPLHAFPSVYCSFSINRSLSLPVMFPDRFLHFLNLFSVRRWTVISAPSCCFLGWDLLRLTRLFETLDNSDCPTPFSIDLFPPVSRLPEWKIDNASSFWSVLPPAFFFFLPLPVFFEVLAGSPRESSPSRLYRGWNRSGTTPLFLGALITKSECSPPHTWRIYWVGLVFFLLPPGNPLSNKLFSTVSLLS